MAINWSNDNNAQGRKLLNASGLTDAAGAAIRPEVFLHALDTTGVQSATAAIQAAIDATPGGAVIRLPAGTITLSGTVTLTANHSIVGAGKTATYVQCTNGAVYAFEYLTPIQASGYTQRVSLEFRDFTLFAKYGIRLNQSGTFSTVFDKQGAIVKPKFHNLRFIGQYLNGVNDANEGGTVEPTFSELEGYGIAIRLAKVMEAEISKCEMQNFGIFIYLDGSDLNKITNNRLETAGRWVHIWGHDTWGGQNVLEDNFFSNNRRLGGIYLQGPMYTIIRGGYLETYVASARYIETVADVGTLIEAIRWDNSGTSTAAFRLAPAKAVQVRHLRYQPNTGAEQWEILSTYYSASNPLLAEFGPNEVGVPVPRVAGVREHTWRRNIFSPFNYDGAFGGTYSGTWPWTTHSNGVIGLRTNGSGGSFIFNLYAEVPADQYTIEVTGRRTAAGTGGYANVSFGGTAVHNANFGHNSTAAIQTQRVTINRPAGVAWTSNIQFEFVTEELEIYDVRVVPVYPSGGGSGDMTKAVYDSNNDGRIDAAALGTGTANNTTILYGDNVWRAAPSGGGGGRTANLTTTTATSLTINLADYHEQTIIANPTGTLTITVNVSGITASDHRTVTVIRAAGNTQTINVQSSSGQVQAISGTLAASQSISPSVGTTTSRQQTWIWDGTNLMTLAR